VVAKLVKKDKEIRRSIERRDGRMKRKWWRQLGRGLLCH